MTEHPCERAVILAAGLGRRMRAADAGVALTPAQAAAADRGNKALLPAGRPFLDHVLHVLAEAGYRDICLVIGPDHDEIRQYYSGLRLKRISVSFAIQPTPRGTADALLAAESFVTGSFGTGSFDAAERFLVINADNYYPLAACAALRQLEGPGLAAFEREALVRRSNISAERIHNFAALQIDADGYLQRIIEKPDAATLARLGSPSYLSLNCWLMTPQIFTACRRTTPSVRGELEITDAVQFAIDELHLRFRALPFAEPVLELSSRRDIPGIVSRLAQREVDL